MLSKEGISKRRELLAVSDAADKEWKLSITFSNWVTALGKNVSVELGGWEAGLRCIQEEM